MFVAVLATALLLSTGVEPAAQAELGELDDRMQPITEQAIAWLSAQQVPNSTVADPQSDRRHLPLSYQIPAQDPARGALGGRAFTYDAAVSAIAFTAVGEYRRAENILLTLGRLAEGNDFLWFAYNTDNAWPNENDHGGALVRTGTVAWAGYAATFYLRMTDDEPVTPVNRRVREQILRLARNTADFALERQVREPGDPRYGLVTGGSGTYSLRLGNEGGIEEVFEDSAIDWASTEHNIDSFFLFHDLFHLTGEEHYRTAANRVAAGLDTLWSEDAGQLIQGIKGDGTRDTVLPLDTASWGALFYAARGRDDRVAGMLESIEDRFRQEDGESAGYVPYGASPVYEDAAIAQRYLGTRDATWTEHGPIWIEGSLGVATAYAAAGMYQEATRILVEMEDFQLANGGFRYANRTIPYIFSDYRSVASTAWYVIAERFVHDQKVGETFWSGG